LLIKKNFMLRSINTSIYPIIISKFIPVCRLHGRAVQPDENSARQERDTSRPLQKRACSNHKGLRRRRGWFASAVREYGGEGKRLQLRHYK